MRDRIDKAIEKWRLAGVIDAATAARLREHEAAAAVPTSGRLAVLAFGLGGLLVAAGVLLFVAAHWADLGPAAAAGHRGAQGDADQLPVGLRQ